MRICKVCGATSEETRIYGDVCRKHYLQFKRHGRYLERTIYDPNKFIVDGDIVKIELYDTKGSVTGYGLIDYEDLEKVKDIKWYLKQGYVRGSLKGDKVFLHRVIMDVPEGMVIDHINKEPLDNRKQNLRCCSQEENCRNRHYSKTGKHVGVKKVPSGKYQAAITVKYKTVYLGTFISFDEAVNARKEAEVKYFGEYRPQ